MSSSHRSRRGFIRSSTVVAVAGLASGFSVIATAVNNSNLELRSAIATIVSAAVVALADWIVRRRRLAQHEENVRIEHEKTRSLIRSGGRKSTRKKLDFK